MKENARKIALYFVVYKNYLQNNNLVDDSKTISVKDLIEFVDALDKEDEVDWDESLNTLISL